MCPQMLTSRDDVTCAPCGHMYHRNCVAQWLVNNSICPQPQCTRRVSLRSLRKIHLTTSDDEESLEDRVEDLHYAVESMERRIVRRQQEDLDNMEQRLTEFLELLLLVII